MPTILKVWGSYEYDSPVEKFEYEQEVLDGLDPELYWLIAQGLLFRNGWWDVGCTWKVFLNGVDLT